MSSKNSQKNKSKTQSKLNINLVRNTKKNFPYDTIEQLDVLLVENNPEDARLIQRMLSERVKSYNLVHVQRISEANSTLAHLTFDVILLDLGLPDSEGIKSLKAVKVSSVVTPVIALTGFDDESLGIRALKLGAQDYLVKGDVDSKQLLRSIRYALERKRAELELRESEEKFRSLIHNIPDVTWIANSEGRMTYISPNAYLLFGFPSDEFTDTTRLFFFDRIHPDDKQLVRKFYNKLLIDDIPYDIEYRFKRKNGSWIWINERVSSTKGVINQYTGIFSNITQNKKAEEALQEAKNRYQMLVEQLEQGVVLINEKGIIEFCNRKAAEMFEYQQDELIGKSRYEITSDSAKEKVEKETENRRKGIISNYEAELLTKTGKLIATRITSSPVYLENKYKGSLSVVSDVTKYKKMQQNLEREKTISETIIKSLPGQFLLYTEIEGKYELVRWNNEVERLKGLSHNKLSGYDILRDIHPSDKKKALKSMKDAKEFGVSFVELRIIDKENKYHEYLGTTSSLELNGQTYYIGSSIDITKQKQMADKLRRDEERSRILLELTQKNILSVDELVDFALDACVKMTESEIGYLHFYNGTDLQLYSWSKNVHKSCTATRDLHYPVEKAGIWADCIHEKQPVIHNDYSKETEKKGLPKGHITLKRHMSVPIFDGDQIVAVVGVGNKIEPYNDFDAQQLTLFINDMWKILNQRRAEEELKINENRLAMSVEASGAGIYEHSVQHDDYTFYDDRWLEILGYNRQEMPKSSEFFNYLKSIVHPDDLQKLINVYEEFTTNPRAEFELEVRFQHKKGHWVYTRSLAKATERNKEGRATHIVGVMLDITEKKEADLFLLTARDLLKTQVEQRTRDLTTEKHRIETIIETIPDGIAVIDNQGNFYLVNKVFKEIYSSIFRNRLPPSTSNLTLLQNTFADTIYKQYLNMVDDIQTIEPMTGLHLQLIAAPVTMPSEKQLNSSTQTGMIISVRDVTPFVELDNLRKQFVSTVSHELRTPITAINLSLNNLQKFGDKISKDQQEEIIGMTIDSSQVLTQMIEDLLIVSSIDAGKMKLQLEKYPLEKEVKKVLRSLDTRGSSKSINFKLKMDPNIHIVADKKRISQVLRIFVENAIKYSDNNSSLDIQVIDSYVGDYNINNEPGTLFQIKDQGCGISQREIPYLFERFFRSPNVSDRVGGTGLGLSIANEIVNLHSGHIIVRSTLGKGSTFSFFIPKLDLNRLKEIEVKS